MASTEPAAAPAPKDPASSPSPHHAPPPPPPPSTSTTTGPPPTSGTHPNNPNNPNNPNSSSHPSVVSGHTHQQLASLLEAAFGENAALRDKLAVTGRRLEHAERVANRLTSAFSDVPNGTSNSSSNNSNNNNNGGAGANAAAVVVNAEHLRRIAELEMQVVALEEARGDAEGRARAVLERWAHVEGHLHELGVGAQRAQRDFALFLRESLPLGSAHAHQGYAPYPVNLGLPPNTSLRRGRTPSMDTMHPPSKRSRGNDGGHRYTHSNSYPPQMDTLPPAPSNPPYRARLIQHPPHHRPRSSSHSSVESVDEFMSKTVQPDEGPSSSNNNNLNANGTGGASLQILHAQGSVHASSAHGRRRKGEVRLTDAEALAQAQAQQAAAISAAQSHPHPSHHHPSSLTHTQSLTQTQSQNQYLPGGGVYSARRVVDGGNAYPASQSVPGRKVGDGGAGGGGGYTTHIFAPVQTGAPMKKGKYGSAGGGSFGETNATSTLQPHPTLSSTLSTTPGLSTSTPGLSGSGTTTIGAGGSLQPNFPATNEAGQRICRQCGQAGRYKEGKCVEKWGPGPAGPGTVCDRCRKKMKRVERRGTLESQQQLAAAHLAAAQSHAHLSTPPVQQHQPHSGGAALGRSDTMPVEKDKQDKPKVVRGV
ncbi:hypothetical protein DFP72DRAFT_387962 [Ephemerocybe angulata]|uniref:Uncharacterized protein n=1 Tax=Ephemerocybe angulata TaxID=980116 RepID=A0A8H6HVJ6_9AGAR|nr:hypothetical protein DFP72DRAFT_387962 [Tulosesus angulatus]